MAMFQKVSYQGSKPGWWLREEPVNGGGEYSRHRTLAVRPEEIVLGCRRPEIYSVAGRAEEGFYPRQ